MGLTWRRRKPPARRISILPGDSAEAFHTLSGLVRGMNETVQSLWDTVSGLRRELDTVRPAASISDHGDLRPPIWLGPPGGADPAAKLDTLQLQFDALNGDAESLWFEAQWLRAQIAVALTSVSPPGPGERVTDRHRGATS